MQQSLALSYISTALLLGLAPLVAAHGDTHGGSMEGMNNMGGSHGSHNVTTINSTIEPSYFRHPEYQGWLYAHIATMVLAWVIALPLGVMLSIARSRLAIPVQLFFLTTNAIGVFTSIVYNTHTPDLYPNNVHHKLGWIATAVTVAWFIMALPMILRDKHTSATPAAHSMTAQNMARYARLQDTDNDGFTRALPHRMSRDSDASATLCSSPHSPSEPVYRSQEPHADLPFHDDFENGESASFLPGRTAPASLRGKFDAHFSAALARMRPSGYALSALKVVYTASERGILVLGFMTLVTGLVTWGNLFRDRLVFSGAAHGAKGGIFIWYGLLTLGRWMGAFAEWGWAWNVRPSIEPNRSYSVRDAHSVRSHHRAQARMPSAEFVESFVIWLYGATNVFLEHLNAWGNEWSFEDFEHISITIMFFGGGLLGMLVESEKLRALFNAGVVLSKEQQTALEKGLLTKEQEEGSKLPKSYKHSLNPMPALVIMLLGRMMSGHMQTSMVSSMMHAQWGSLFVGFALARGATYVMLYLSPPTSFFPGRPPTELVASFCLISGGMIFMGSATDAVATIEGNGLDAMFLFTVAMGFTALIMAWAAICFAVKGWAIRREAKKNV